MNLQAEAAALGVALSPGQAAALEAYRDAIAGATARFNLTAVRDPAAIERRHILEALALGADLSRAGAMPEGARVIDVGSGAGLPGLPLKLAWPALRVALLEANGKRCRFLREVIDALGIVGIEVLEGRAEDWGRDPAHREAYDVAVARAVAPLAVLLEYALPFLRVGGVLAAPKGSAATRELTESGPALRELGGEVESVTAFQPPYGPAQTLVLVRKTARTPPRYPRRQGAARKRPLGSGGSAAH